MADNENPAQVRRPSVRGTFQETLLKLMVRGPVWTLSLLTRPQFIYMITSYAFKRGTPMVMPQPATAPGTAPSSAPPPSTGVYGCSFANGEPMELRVWLTSSATHDPATAGPPTLERRGLKYDYNMPTQTASLHVPPTPELLERNGTAHLHASLSTPRRTVTIHYQLTKFLPPPPPSRFKNLLESTAEERAELEKLKREHESKPWVSYWKNNVTLAIVTDMVTMNMVQTPPQIRDLLHLDHTTMQYDPKFYVNDFWTYRDHYYVINSTVTSLPVDLVFQTQGLWAWQLTTQMQQSFETQASWGALGGGGTGGNEMDEMKRMLSETNPWFLGLTMVVSIVHMVFDFLAFKNDISFWKSRKSLEGLSVRSILVSFTCQLIIFLYLADSDTSWMILLSAGISVVIEGWKITKTNDVTLSRAFPFVHLADKSSYSSKTKEFDEVAMRYLSYVVYPLMVVYAGYSLLYDTHKSYYSWLIGSASGAVYMFGFLQMTPQLFINYKLKSVAHLPWRVFVYKALNTFIDDLFAFIIKMPTLHRLSVFRDDIIFFIFLYQRYIYGVDKTRVNEFGQSFEHEQPEASAPDANKSKTE